MSRIPNSRPEPAKGPPPRREPVAKPRMTRQKRERMDDAQEYLAVHDVFLRENPVCARVGCYGVSNQIRHICRGVHRERSLVNTETWLPACSPECHDWLESQPIKVQILIKMLYVQAVCERLRK